MRFSRLALIPLAAAGAVSMPSLAGAVTLAPHRAVYDLALEDASDKSGITGIAGRMVYEFNGSPCEGYTVSFRFVTRIDTSETSRMTDQQTTTFEEGDGKSFSFVTKTFTDRTLERELRGKAIAEPNGLKVDLDKPQTSNLELKKTQFPTQHLVELIGKAEKGESFYETNLFDGSEDADKVMTTTVVVGKRATPKAGDPEVVKLKSLEKEAFWPVDIAYFDDTAASGEELPQYRISFKLHENGLTRDLIMDYGDFSMTGHLVDLKMLDAPESCAE